MDRAHSAAAHESSRQLAPCCATGAGPAPAELEVRRALGAGAADDAVARMAVGTFVRRLRDRGVPPERALIAVKRAARVALAPSLATPLGAATHETAEARLAEVVRWCIEEYYR